MQSLNAIIEESFDNRENLTRDTAHPELAQHISQIINDLEAGKVRVAEKINGSWKVNSWIKKAVILSFALTQNKVIDGTFAKFYDKVPLQFTDFSEEEFKNRQIRVVPTACVRNGAYIGKKTVLMPSYVNIGAYVGNNCMIDTWATVGSCAQIGNNVHISGGTGIGGVLEPIQAQPTIIEDDCFIGARSEIVEGVIVEAGSVISMGVFIGQSTKIYDRNKDEIIYGRVPAGSVVVPGSLPGKNGKYNMNCAVIIKTVDEKTRNKVGINNLLREE